MWSLVKVSIEMTHYDNTELLNNLVLPFAHHLMKEHDLPYPI